MTVAKSSLLSARRANEDGFTLIELLVVIVIIGLLGTIVAINVFGALGTSNVAKVKADIATLESALEQYRLDNLTYPSTSDGIWPGSYGPVSQYDIDLGKVPANYPKQ